MAKRRKIVKIKLTERCFVDGYASYFHSRENPIVLGYDFDEGNYMVQKRLTKKSYTWLIPKQYATLVQKPLILISVESEDTRKAEPQAQNK